jgi:hypothetical protein
MEIKPLILFFTFCIVCNSTYSQINLTGTVSDTANNPIQAASITLSKANSSVILAFVFSNVKGQYTLNYNTIFKADSFTIKVNCIGYKAQVKAIHQANETINFSLKTGALNLPSVVINNRPILKIKGDTISYNVDSFTYKQDRVIGDVLKRIPGIDVDNNGRISYNGKSISNLYLDGDDLLNDRYNIATQSVPNDLVNKVQILENHQPIKALKDAAISDKVAINLSLKNKARVKIIGRAELAGGVENIYNESLYLMAFKKKFKAVNSIKSTNAGNNIANDITAHNFNDFLKLLESNQPTAALGLSNAVNPNLPQHRYLFNKAALINFNNLIHLEQDVILKANLFYLYDKQTQNYTYTSTTYLQNDTIKYTEKQQTQQRNNNTHLQLNLNINKDKFYLNNTVITEFNNYPSLSNLDNGSSYNQQNLLQKNQTFSNEFRIIKTTNIKNVIEAYSYFSYLNKPEELNISPNLNASVFNNNISYQTLTQQYNVPTYYTNNYVSFRHPSKHFIQVYKFGFSSQWQHLQSTLTTTQLNTTITNLKDSFNNYISWNYYKPYASANIDYTNVRTQLSFNLPLQYHSLNYNDTIRKNENTNQYLFLNPSIRLKYQTGIENYIVFNYNYSNSLSSISSIYQGLVLQNFRVLNSNNIPIVTSQRQSVSFSFNFRKAIKILFANVGLSYSTTQNESIGSNSFYKTIQNQNSVLAPNTVNSYGVNSMVSKYIFNLHSTATLKLGWQQNQWNQLQQSTLLNYENNNLTGSFSLSSKVSNWLNTFLSSNFNQQTSINQSTNKTNQSNPSTIQWQHTVELNIIPKEDWYIKLNADDYTVIQQQQNIKNDYFFADATLTHKANKIKADFSFSIVNIFNTTEYTTAILSANNFTQSSYIIRPRMFVLKASFNL